MFFCDFLLLPDTFPVDTTWTSWENSSSFWFPSDFMVKKHQVLFSGLPNEEKTDRSGTRVWKVQLEYRKCHFVRGFAESMTTTVRHSNLRWGDRETWAVFLWSAAIGKSHFHYFSLGTLVCFTSQSKILSDLMSLHWTARSPVQVPAGW